MNTMVRYCYTDGANYKKFGKCVIKGVMSTEQESTVLASLDEGEFFIPEMVGIPALNFDKEFGHDEDLDHPWCHFPVEPFMKTIEVPTVNLTVDEFVDRFKKAAENHWPQ